MVTRKEIDFSTYNQTFYFIRLDFFSRILVRIISLLKINASAYKLVLYEKILNFLRTIGLATLSENMPLAIIKKSLSEIYKSDSENKVNRSFIEFLYQFKVLLLKKNAVIVNNRYERLIKKDVIKKIVNHENQTLTIPLKKRERKMVHDFLFVKDLIKKYNNPEYNFQYINTHIHYWELLIAEKKLDYEIRLCETLYNLLNFKTGQKIKSPFNEDYYTESGQNAFKNFTRFTFLKYIKNIHHENNKINVLDIGCGYGNYIEAIHGAYPDSLITGIELNPDVWSVTKKKFEGIGDIEISNKNIFDFSVDNKYDSILLNYVLFYFDYSKKKELLEKIKDMITDNGSIIINQYFSGIENLKIQLAKKQNDYSLSKRIEMYYSNKILYANTLWNDAVDTFSEAIKWDELQTIIKESGLHIESMTNADNYYYSLFIELKR